MLINVSGTWRDITSAFINVSGIWQSISNAFINVSGLWRSIFTAQVLEPQFRVAISQSTNGTTYLTTLTGTNYYWSPGPPSLTYRFQWWNGVSWSDISTGNAINPSYGSATSYTQLLQSTGPSVYVQPNQVNRFRFKVDATYGVQSASSESLETTIQGPTSVTLTEGTATTTSVNLSWTPSTGANRYMVYYSTNNSVFTLFNGAPSTLATVTGLVPGTLYYFKVIPITGSTNDTGYYGSYSNTVSQTTSAGSALTPTFGANTSTAGGFTGSVTNYNSSWPTWNISTSVGSVSWGTINGSTYPFTVSGLSSGASATVTVTTSRTGYTSGSNTTTGTATTQVPVNTVAPTIAPTSGTAGVTAYSVTSVGSWTNSPTGYTYLWQSSDNPPTNSIFVPAPGTNNLYTYTPPSNFFTLGYTSPIRCRVIASNAGGNSVSPAFSNQATVSAPVSIPSGGTVSISTNTGNYTVGSVITYSTTGWANTPTSYSLRLYNGTNPVLTSDPLRASTSSASSTYTIVSGDVPNYFKAFATASNSAGTSTEANSTQVGPAVATFVAPTSPAPSWTSGSNFQRITGSSILRWYTDYPSISGDGSIVGMEFEIRTTAGGGTLLASNQRAYPGAGTYPYSGGGTIWAFRCGTSDGDISYSASARFARARVVMLGTNSTTYYGTWSGWI